MTISIGFGRGAGNMTGQLVSSKAGHDKGTLYVVTAEEGDFVYLCDGRLKTPDKPKKKRRKHVQPINALVDGRLLEKLVDGGTIYAEEIRYALRQYEEKRMQAGIQVK